MAAIAVKVWRIAGVVAFLCGAALALLIAYQVLWLGNHRVISNLSGIHPNPLVAVLLVEVLVVTFMLGLITFPYYWVKGAALIFRFWATVLGRPSHLSWKEAGFFAAGLAASCACILVTLWLAHSVVGINGKG